ncbi:leucine-rich repeats and immunoglobulin-like domains protein 1 isoform X4 [Pristis pectinata]|uniref:leucine-rich repeats and immunoglobulin-like domains protein 1 isoform X4 n=1 Tax=Pristis pectinata TaxID=685728 RepID=UPI00223E04B8|nr:leucine-rich repeats and immunoglobulin-like domains protein 1 isoform X4 [Pristis pectinata]
MAALEVRRCLAALLLVLAYSAPPPVSCAGLGRGRVGSVTRSPAASPCISGCTCSGQQLDCSKQAWTRIPRQLPAWVVYLNLSYNKLASIDPTVFTELPNLREVRLDHNELTMIPDMGLASAHLVFLYLHHNKIRSIEANHLKLYESLETLDLTYNEITEIQNNCFPQQLKIKDLYLGNNRISIVEPGTFDNLSSTLQVLRLSKNRISHLPVKVFKLPHLVQLELNRNRIRLIDGLTFHGLDNLEVLKLQRNNISKLMDGAFWGLAKMQVLHLDNNILNEVTSGWLYGLSSLQQLFLSYNSISRINPDAWGFCQKLVELNLSHNNLMRLDEGSLVGLSGLQFLRLSHNSINHIADGAFKGLRSLQVLELDNNEISGIIEDTNGAFAGLDNLSKLTLFGNKIKSVAKKAFVGLEALEHLNLGNNMIRSIQGEALSRMKSLKELYMNSDSFLCDCQLKWLPQWLIGRDFQSNVVGTCAHPESLKGKSIFIVPTESFVCDDFPKPQIIVQPETTMAMLGRDIRFTCSAASSSNFPMIFAWKKDHEILHNAEIENFAHVRAKDGEVMEYTTILHLRNVKFSDEGRYQCMITNNFGSTYSTRAKLTVNVLPSFVKTPRDITIRTGANARLECAATGHPTPQIAWQKDGGTDFPAARERRMHVMPEDDVFFIVDVKTEDMGVYSCTAQNIAGAISVNASLTVLETPSLIYPLEDQTVVIGETIALQCMASGSPSPRITWLKDETIVPPDVPSYLSSQGTLSERQDTSIRVDGSSNLQLAAPIPSGHTESNGVCRSDAGSFADVDSRNIHYRKAKYCVGCNIKDECKNVTEGKLCSEKIGLFGVQPIVCMEQFDNASIYPKELEASSSYRSMDHSPEEDAKVQNRINGGILNHYPCNGTSSSMKEREGPVYPSNHDRMTSQPQTLAAVKIVDKKDTSSQPVQLTQELHNPVHLPSLEASGNSALLCEKPRTLLHSNTEVDIKQTLLLNGQFPHS